MQCTGVDCQSVSREIAQRTGKSPQIHAVVEAGHPVLRQRAQALGPARIKTPEIQTFLDNLAYTMVSSGGIGLAAPQVASNLRVLVMKFEGKVLHVINPEVTVLDRASAVNAEGCLSIPGVSRNVSRPKSVRVSFLDRNGQSQTLDFKGFAAAVVQHEIDHLNGVLITDK